LKKNVNAGEIRDQAAFFLQVSDLRSLFQQRPISKALTKFKLRRIMNPYKMLKMSVSSTIVRATMIVCGMMVVGSTLTPAIAKAREVTSEEVAAIRSQLINATTPEELQAALKSAQEAGAPWQYLYESVVLYSIKTGDYSLADTIMAHLKQYANDFTVANSLLFNSEKQAAVFIRVFLACIDLTKGDKDGALANLQEAQKLDPETLKVILPHAVTIQKYFNV
jgi:hypothetical protein